MSGSLPGHADSRTPDMPQLQKITVRFLPVGSAKRLRTSVFNVPGDNQFGALVNYLRRQLAYTPTQSLFCYINASFSPSLDANLAALHEAYAVDGTLNISYCATVAFG